MRYYRLWIYACNLVLLGSAVGFSAAVSQTLLFTSDPRRYVVPGVPHAFDLTALYGYLALAAQLGLVQMLGCIAARRLNARLLNIYWIVLLVLLFGDAVIGVAWIFRFEKMRAELRPTLRLRLQVDYDKEPRFSEQWDRLQREFMCCGVTGPRDFGSRWPQTCCATSINASDPCQHPYGRGCEESLVRWLRKTADLLFVLGFCVIAFAKLCFLGILRYEIREMIQKIRMLREPPPPATPFAQPPFCQMVPEAASNGSIARCATMPNTVTPVGNASLLLQSEECNPSRHPLLANNLQDGGADSDTNSNCALILEETTPTSASNHNNCTAGGGHEKSNGNNNYEMREFNRRLLLSNGASPGTGVNAMTSQSRRT
ncbi:CD63 antigen [Ooceraea biroi]|nr:CD63 antigen [Ooceraea biroi]